MDTLAFDGRMGASGDMLLAALLAAGADPDALAPVEDALPVEYDVGETEKNGISATRVIVRSTHDAPDDPTTGQDADESTHDHEHSHDLGHGGSHDHGHKHSHDHDHEHPDDHEHGGSHDHDHEHGGSHDHHDEGEQPRAEGHGPHRAYAEVVALVESMGLPSGVESEALAVFRVLGEAEAAVHGTDLDETHFHEVGADDAIADVVGACLLLDDLGVERVVTTPLATGGGAAAMSHGTYPVPTPAVVEIAAEASWALQGGPVEAELLTPTGAAILTHVAEGVETLPSMRVRASGYGAGGYSFDEHPNVLRAIVGETRGGLVRDEVRVLETNVDDVTPEVLGGLHDSLAAVGARDVSVVPLSMKKSRPGHLVKVVVKPEDAGRVARRLARETGTLGVRETGVRHRFVANRAFETVEIDVGDDAYDVTVKVASDDAGDVFDVSAEYDEAAAVARETGLPVRDVIKRVEAAYRADDGGGGGEGQR